MREGTYSTVAFNLISERTVIIGPITIVSGFETRMHVTRFAQISLLNILIGFEIADDPVF